MITQDEAIQAALGMSWSDAEAQAERLIEAARTRVATWETDRFESKRERPEAYAAERHGNRRADSPIEYGLSADGAVVVARQRVVSIWLDAVDGGRALLVFDPDDGLISLTRPVVERGRVVAVEAWYHHPHGATGGWLRETYEYDDAGRVREVDRVRDNGRRVKRSRLVARHDDDSELLTLTAVDDEESTLVYRRSPPGAAKAAQKLVTHELPARIRAWAARMAPDEPVYCLAILYAPDGVGFVPSLGLGTEAERRRWLAAGERELIWSPPEYRIFDPEPAELAGDDEFAHACQVLAQEWEATHDERQPRALIMRAAKALDLEGVRQTEPFAVFAVDDELADLERNLEALVPKAARAALEG